MFPHPEVNIFGIEISAYSLISVVGMLFCVAVFYGLARHRKMLRDDLFYMSLSAIIGLLVGAHILFGITRIPATITEINQLLEKNLDGKFNYIIEIIFDNWNGMVFYGGLLGAILAIIIYCRKFRLDTFKYMDLYTETRRSGFATVQTASAAVSTPEPPPAPVVISAPPLRAWIAVAVTAVAIEVSYGTRS